jgi:cytochrome d ubiquinol oxidase subunit I
MVFNPSSAHRLNHVVIGALMAAAFFVLSISAFYILKKRHLTAAKRSFTMALAVGLIASIAAPISGHFQADKVAETQPAKLAAFEGHFTSAEEGTPLWLFGIPDEEEQRVKHGIAVPGLLSFLVHGSFSEPVTALDTFKPEDRPPVQLTFQSYHAMVAAGMFCLLLAVLGAYYWRRGTLFEKRWLLWVFVFGVLAPQVANQAGWVAAEVGRQPWIVYPTEIHDGLRTSDAISASVSREQILGSLIMFGVLYVLLFLVWIYVLNDKIKQGPVGATETPPPGEGGFLEAAAVRADPGGAAMTEGQPGAETGSAPGDREGTG